jgi:hypothetical protein
MGKRYYVCLLAASLSPSCIPVITHKRACYAHQGLPSSARRRHSPLLFAGLYTLNDHFLAAFENYPDSEKIVVATWATTGAIRGNRSARS